MKFKRLFDIAIVVALVGAAEEREFKNYRELYNANRAYGYFEIPQSIPDFVVGLAMGAYGGVNSRNREADCFSLWYDLGV